jgi:hypothetical protein
MSTSCRTRAADRPGPADGLLDVTVTTDPPSHGASTLAVTTLLVARADGPRIILQPAASALVLSRDGVVLAVADGIPGVQVPLEVRAGATRPAQVVPTVLPLVDCDGRPLPAGTYTLVAVVGYGQDPLNGAAAGSPGTFTLTSPPIPVTLR